MRAVARPRKPRRSASVFDDLVHVSGVLAATAVLLEVAGVGELTLRVVSLGAATVTVIAMMLFLSLFFGDPSMQPELVGKGGGLILGLTAPRRR